MSDDPAVSTESEEREPGSTHTSAHELGDITAQRLQGGLRKLAQTVGTEGDGVDYYRFTLSEAREVRLGLKLRQGEAELYLEDAEGNVLARSMAYAGFEVAVRTLLPGTYYVRVEAVGAAASEYDFRCGVLEANASFRPASNSAWYAGFAAELGMPSFEEAGYGFELSETVDGSVSGVLLGTVLAVDPNGEELSYRIVGGNGSGLFALGGASGELSYVGAGEDFEGGAGPYELTVRASDGTHTIDTTVTVTITDAAEAPAFSEEGYAFALTENVDGRVNRLSLGTVTATDPDNDTVRYSLLGGNDSDLFAIGETSGELYYVGAGEDYESGVTSYELTVRASDGTQTVDTTVTITITDEAEAPAFSEEGYAFALTENVDGSVNQISLGVVESTDPESDTVRYSLLGGNDSSLFAIGETSGELYYVGPGEDYESGVTSYELTVRASDAAHTVDTTVTVTVTDAPEAPAFAGESYAFELAENVDGRVNRLSLGTVTATDPDSDTVRYSLLGGNDSDLFAIGETSGELYYVGAGEDYESGVTSYELTVRASDAAHTVDTTVTVTVTDAADAPAFREVSYAFALSENTDGRVNRLSLGTVTATDPDGDTVRYRLAGGNESELFAIGETSGELYYVGPGEDYESGVTSYELTVRASDGTHASDTTVTVALGDVRGRSEPEGGDLPQDRTTTGLVLVDEAPVTGNIESTWDLDWFAVELVAGRTYQIDFRGQPTGDGTLVDPFLYGMFDGDGRLIRGTTIPDGGTSHNSRLVFTAPGEGTYYIATSGNGTHPSGTGTYELEVRDVRAPVFAESGYRFALPENAEGSVNRQSLGTVTATDPDGGTVRYRLVGGNESQRFAIDPDTGEVFYVGPGEDYESRVTSHELTVRASDGAYSTQVSVTVTVTDAAESPAFAAESYTFELAENVDGSDEWLSLGTVMATDPDGDGAVRYSLAGDNASDLFAIDAASGELYYIGSGEDFESGVTSYELTVRASDAAHTVDTTVTVTVTDAPEAPAFEEERYEFALAENTDGSDNRLALGAVTATDPDGDAVRYSLSGGNDSELFAIDETSGELFYVGSGEDFESGVTSHELAVRASDGTHSADTTVTVTVTGLQGNSEPAGQDLPAGRQTTGTVGVDEEPVVGTLGSQSDRDWFAVTLAPGRTYLFSISNDTPGSGVGMLPVIHGLRDSNGDPVPGIDGGVEVEFTTDAGDADAVYYVVVAGDGGSGQGMSGTRSASIRSSNDDGNRYQLWANDITPTNDVTDDYGADITTTGTVAVGGVVTGEIERGGDRDWFAVTLEAGKAYRFDLQGSETGAGTLSNPSLRGIYDVYGNVLPGTTNYGFAYHRDSRVSFTAMADATYYVSAGAYGIGKGTYRLSVTDLTDVPDDFTAGTDTTGAVAVGGSVTGEIERGGDRDWFAVTLDKGKTYQIDLEGWWSGAGTLYDPNLHGIYRADGTRIDGKTNDDGGTGKDSRLRITAPEDAIYYVSAGAHDSAFRSYEGTYRLSVTDVTDSESDDFTAGRDTTGRVTVDGSVTGKIEVLDDRDWFAVTLEEGKTYRFDLQGSETGAGTLHDPYLRGIYDAAGNPVADTTNNDGGAGLDSRVTFRATADAKYYVSVGAGGSGNGTGTGTYKLSVKNLTDDLTAGTDTAGRVAVDGSVTGKIEVLDDRDWFAVTLEEGKTYQIDLEGLRTGGGTLYDPYLHGIYDAESNLVAGPSNDGGTGLNSRMTFRATADAIYYVSVGAGRDGTGTYRLSVKNLTDAPDDFTAGTDTAGAVAVGGSVTGEIERDGDRDWFAVTLEEGKTYQIDLAGHRGARTLRDPYLRGIFDADGNPVADTTNNDGGAGRASRVTFRATADAKYYVSAGASGSGNGTYRLSVTDLTDDFTAGTDTTGRVAVGGSATGRVETPGDRDWFAVSLEEGRLYRIDLSDGKSSWPPFNPYLRGIHDANGNLLPGTTNDNNSQFDGNSRVHFRATEDNTYYVSAGAAYNNLIGPYRLSVTDVTDVPDDFAALTDTTGRVEVGGSATGKLEFRDDRDWFAVTLEAGKTYKFELHGLPPSGTPWDAPHVRGIYDADGNLFSGTTFSVRAYGQDANSRVTFAANEDDTYYVSVSVLIWRGGQITYRLSATDVTEGVPDDFTAGTDTAGRVAVGDSATGKIETPDDRDWFAVSLEEGKTYRFDLEGRQAGAGTLDDPYLRGIHDADGNLLPGTTNDNNSHHRDSRVYFKATEDTIYYVSAGAAHNYLEGTYRLSVKDVTDDFTAWTDTTGRVAVGGSATGEFEIEGDRDWFAVSLETGRTYRFDLEGKWTDVGTLSDPYLRGIHDADGNLMDGTTDDDGGSVLNSRGYFTASEDTTYYVAADASGKYTVPIDGTYRLSVTDVTGVDDFTAGTDTAGRVAVDGSVTGKIELPGDRDWFAVSLEAGKTYRIDLEGSWTHVGTLNDPYLHGIFDAEGNLIDGTTDDDGGQGRNSRVTYIATDDDTYYVAAGAIGDTDTTFGEREGTYTLSVEEVIDGM